MTKTVKASDKNPVRILNDQNKMAATIRNLDKLVRISNGSLVQTILL